uniref:Uncharacterized protein n=1 Tax=Oscillatoriales cyanobacterium SpSt-402 TaxID=2282168 RepID=A0A832H0X9_9CYAN
MLIAAQTVPLALPKTNGAYPNVNGWVPLRAIQEVPGHLSLLELQKYLEVSLDQQRAAVMVVNF